MIRKDWYSPSEIIPTREQLEDFILPNMDQLRCGYYPQDPRATGRPGTNGSTCAKFVPAAELAAEIDSRLQRITKRVAITLRYIEFPQWTIEKISRELNMDEEKLDAEIWLMLHYLAGRRRKQDDFAVWKSKIKKKKVVFTA